MGSKNRSNKWTWGFGIGFAILALAVTGFMTGTLSVSGVGTSTEGKFEGTGPATVVINDNLGDAATISLAAYDSQNNNKAQVLTAASVWKKSPDADGKYPEGDWTFLGNTSTSATARTSITGINVGDKIQLVCYDATYIATEADVQTFTMDATSETINCNTHKRSTSSTLTFFDEDDNSVTANVTMGTTPYTFNKLRFKNTADQTAIIPYVLAFDYPATTNISAVNVNGADRYTTKIKRLSGVDEMFIYTPGVVNNAASTANSPSVTVQPDGDAITLETLTVYVIDIAPYVGATDKQLYFGIQDDTQSQSDVGISDVSASVLLL